MPIRAGVFFDMFPFCILYEVRDIERYFTPFHPSIHPTINYSDGRKT